MKIRSMCVLLCAVLALSLCASMSQAQTVTGTLSGRVTDKSGAVMPGVKVVAKNEETGFTREAVSNEEGYYLMTFLQVGNYTVTVQVQGFKTVTKKAVSVELNKNTVSDFVMEPAAVTSVIEVTGETPQIETTIGELKHSLDNNTIEQIPLSGRNYISLVEQIPGFQNAPWIGSSNNPTNSTGSYAVFNGIGSRQTTFQIDGVNNDDSSENQNRQNVNISTIKEVQVLTNAYSAEFGRGGAAILVQTKSGTNEFHGDAYDFIQNDILNANGFFANRSGTPRPRVRRNQWGGTIGGPILKDKLFFFGSSERIENVGTTSITRFKWLPSDGPRICSPGEVPRPGRDDEPLGNYCIDPATHPNAARDLDFIRSIMDFWNTPEFQNVTPDPNDTVLCPDLVPSGRPNRCARVDGLPLSIPNSDYTGRIDWQAPWQYTINARYQYSRQLLDSPRIILGDNFGLRNSRQYNIGLTVTKVFSNRQTGEFRFGFGNRATIQDVADGGHVPIAPAGLYQSGIPIIRFANTLTNSGTVIGTSGNVPINRRQHDQQYVYNHTIVFNRHTLKAGVDLRWQLLDDISSNFHRGFWTFSTLDTLGTLPNPTCGTVRNPFVPGDTTLGNCPTVPTSISGFTGWENFLRGFFTGFQKGYGPELAENRYGEVNTYIQDDWRILPTLTLNLGFRWEGVRAPTEKEGRFEYGFGDDYNNWEPRLGFAWTPGFNEGWLRKLTGGSGNFVVRGGYGITHSRLFQSIFSQTGLSIRSQPPYGFTFGFTAGVCATNTIDSRYEISDPTCGFTFTPGSATGVVTQPPSACSAPGTSFNGVRILCGQLQGILLRVDPNLQVPYNQQWNLTIERQFPWKMAVQLAYTGGRGIGTLFYDSFNDAEFPFTSTNVFVDVGGGNFQPVVFDRVCVDFSDPICLNTGNPASFSTTASGANRTFSALNSTTASLAAKGIVIVNGVPHGYISRNTTRVNERRPDPNFQRLALLRNFGWTYNHSMILKVTKRYSHGLTFTGSWTFAKTIDTGSESTFTGVDVNVPTGQRDPARSLRGLSSFHATHRVVLTYSYELPFWRTQPSWYGRAFGGWVMSGTTTFQSGTPFTVEAGYDVNLDGVGGDRPFLLDPSLQYTSIDQGRSFPSQFCPTSVAVGAPCPDTYSQLQITVSAFRPGVTSVASASGDSIPLLPGTNGEGTLARNTFFTHGIKNFDMAFAKEVKLTERMKLQLRMEWYNIFNRVQFGVPARTVVSSTPIGRITSQANLFNYINAARDNGSRMGQIAIRLKF